METSWVFRWEWDKKLQSWASRQPEPSEWIKPSSQSVENSCAAKTPQLSRRPLFLSSQIVFTFLFLYLGGIAMKLKIWDKLWRTQNRTDDEKKRYTRGWCQSRIRSKQGIGAGFDSSRLMQPTTKIFRDVFLCSWKIWSLIFFSCVSKNLRCDLFFLSRNMFFPIKKVWGSDCWV